MVKKRQRKYFSLVLWLLFLISYNSGQVESLRFRNMSSEQGLSQNTISSIIQDDLGFIWVGTQAGLNKIDGYSVTIYKVDIFDSTSISENHVLSLCNGENGQIWIGTEYGLNCFNPLKETFKRFLHNPSDSTSLSSNKVHAIVKDIKGVFWIGTTEGLNKFIALTKRFERICHDPQTQISMSNNEIRSLCASKDGSMWVGTYGGGLNKFDPATGNCIKYQHDPQDPNSICGNYILSLHEDTQGRLWVGTERSGLCIYKNEKNGFAQFHSRTESGSDFKGITINDIYEDHLGKIWIATQTKGVSIFNPSNEMFYNFRNDPSNPNSLISNRILAFFEDRTNLMWIGNADLGIDICNQSGEIFQHHHKRPDNPKGLNDNIVWEIHEDKKGFLWIGTHNGGLNRYDRKKNIYTHFTQNKKDTNSLISNFVIRIKEDRAGILWIGTNKGLEKFDPIKQSFIHHTHDPFNPKSISNNKIRALYEDREGNFWVGTRGGGLNKFDRKTGECVRYKHDPADSTSLSNDQVYSLYEDSRNNFWVGTFGGGLNKFDRTSGRCIRYVPDPQNRKSISGSYVSAILESKDGTLWIGTAGGGLNKFDYATNSFTHYTEKNGLPNDEVYRILEDSMGHIWISTNNGITKFNPKSEVFNHYLKKDGLQSNEFNLFSACKGSDGTMYFGGINGFNSFIPEKITVNPFPPALAITNLKISNKPVPIGPLGQGRTVLKQSISHAKEIILSYSDKVISFEFAALHFAVPEKNQYAYKMEGLDKEWNFVGSDRRFVTYSNLVPGKYVFKVKGANNDGVWNEEGTSVQVIVVPPFWETWWFTLLVILTILCVGGIIAIIQINKIKSKKEQEAREKVIADIGHILEYGRATVYRRELDSEKYEYIGQGIQDITGYTPEEFTLKLFYEIALSQELVGELSGVPLKDAFEQLRQGKLNNFVLDFKLRAKDGTIRWARDITTALFDQKKRRHIVLGILFDITDRKLAEQNLEKVNQEMQRDLNMAHKVQLAFLEKQPSHFPTTTSMEKSSLQFYHKYQPATTLAGDFFKILPISNHKVGLLICDVMGHGARASLLTSYIQGLIEEIKPIATDPGSFVSKLNTGLNTIMYQFDTGMFATLFYMVVDCKSGKIAYTNAGHPSPIVVRRDQNNVEKLYGNGYVPEPAIGLLKTYNYTVQKGQLAENDAILLFTDGVYEVDNTQGKIFGQKRLLNLIQEQVGSKPEKLLDGILDAMYGFAESEELRDDICMVTMHRGHLNVEN